jgi:hypothetical protein
MVGYSNILEHSSNKFAPSSYISVYRSDRWGICCGKNVEKLSTIVDNYAPGYRSIHLLVMAPLLDEKGVMGYWETVGPFMGMGTSQPIVPSHWMGAQYARGDWLDRG